MLEFIIGKPVRLVSPLTIEECLARIREWKSPWHSLSGESPWGWLVRGRLCLWSEISRHSPMLLVRLRPNGANTLISGRAGPNLNGMPWFLLVFGLIIWMLISSRDFGLAGMFVFFFLLILAAHYWSRNDADELVDDLKALLDAHEAKSSGITEAPSSASFANAIVAVTVTVVAAVTLYIAAISPDDPAPEAIPYQAPEQAHSKPLNIAPLEQPMGEGPRRARGNLAQVVSNIDYPEEALRALEQGTVRFRLLIARDGSVSGCIVVESSSSETLDRATCRLMTQRPRFSPALDSEGRPVEDIFESQMKWVIAEG